MAVITKNDYGTIAINNKLLSKLVVDELLSMQGMVFLCNKKGRINKKKPTPFIDPDYYDAVEIDEISQDRISVKVYLVLRFNTNIKKITNRIFDKIEDSFKIFNLASPIEITISYKGIQAETKSKKRLEIKRMKNC